jgi:hypothetical protein
MPPLLPAGFTLFESLPVGALVLDALAPAIGNGLITMSQDGSEGVLVVRNGVVAERVWVTNGVRSHGDEALALIRAADAAMVSARRLDDVAMGLLGALLHGTPCYIDLRLEWVSWPEFLSDLRTRGQTFVVELHTPAGRGVACLRDGSQVATFTESHPVLGDASLLDELLAGGVGTIRVFVDDAAQGEVVHALTSVVVPQLAEVGRPQETRTTADVPARDAYVALTPDVTTIIENEPPRAERIARTVDSGTSGPITLAPPRDEYAERFVLPAAESAFVRTDAPQRLAAGASDPNATFTAMFGLHDETPGEHRLIALNNAGHGAEREVASVLPQLRLLVHHRLQRSSESVEEIVESAATDHQSVGWLSDRVRVMTMRGFLRSTFEQLADDMLALAGRDPD